MLARYHIVRGKRSPDDPLPDGQRIDVRKHRHHALSPEPEMVERYLAAPDEAAFQRFAADYLRLLKRRFASDRDPFDAVAAEARETDVYLGCSCPTKKNPDVRHCHTALALQFMKERYPDLDVARVR